MNPPSADPFRIPGFGGRAKNPLITEALTTRHRVGSDSSARLFRVFSAFADADLHVRDGLPIGTSVGVGDGK